MGRERTALDLYSTPFPQLPSQQSTVGLPCCELAAKWLVKLFFVSLIKRQARRKSIAAEGAALRCHPPLHSISRMDCFMFMPCCKTSGVAGGEKKYIYIFKKSPPHTHAANIPIFPLFPPSLSSASRICCWKFAGRGPKGGMGVGFLNYFKIFLDFFFSC